MMYWLIYCNEGDFVADCQVPGSRASRAGTYAPSIILQFFSVEAEEAELKILAANNI